MMTVVILLTQFDMWLSPLDILLKQFDIRLTPFDMLPFGNVVV